MPAARERAVSMPGACRVAPMMSRWWSLLVGRSARSASQAPAHPAPHHGTQRQGDPVLGERRAEAMRRLFPKCSGWQAPADHWERQAIAYEVLAQATDLADLHRRVRRLQRAGMEAAPPVSATDPMERAAAIY